MGINKRYITKFQLSYNNIPETIIPIEFDKSSPYFYKEEWREVLPLFVPGVLLHSYWISNHGRIYSNIKSPYYPNGGLLIHSVNNKGYHQINLQNVNKQKIGIKVTKLMMLHFKFRPDCYTLEVDHIDTNKDHNYLWNFEWVSSRENNNRAIENETKYSNPKYLKFIQEEDLKVSETIAMLMVHEYMIGVPIINIAKRYNISINYIDYLVKGKIRPYVYTEYCRQFETDLVIY